MHVKTPSLMRHMLVKPIIICLRVSTYSWVMLGSCFTALYERTGISLPLVVGLFGKGGVSSIYPATVLSPLHDPPGIPLPC